MTSALRSVALLIAASGLLAAAPPGPANTPQIVPGKYVQVSPVTKKPLPVGNMIVIVKGKAGKLGFSISAIRALDSNQGFIAGMIPGGSKIMWMQRGESGNCKLNFTAVPGGMTVVQDYGFGDCGFGNGVTANGTYGYMGDPETKR